jgi:hypothetical protein
VVVVAFLRATWRRIAYTQRKGIVTHLFMHYNTPTHSVDCTGCVRDALARFPRGCARFLDRFKAVLSRSQTRGQHACCPVRLARDTRARVSHAEGRGPVGVAASPRCARWVRVRTRNAEQPNSALIQGERRFWRIHCRQQRAAANHSC